MFLIKLKNILCKIGFHSWVYPTKLNRKCKSCKLHQVQFYYSNRTSEWENKKKPTSTN